MATVRIPAAAAKKVDNVAEVCNVEREDAYRLLQQVGMDEEMAVERFLAGKVDTWHTVGDRKKRAGAPAPVDKAGAGADGRAADGLVKAAVGGGGARSARRPVRGASEAGAGVKESRGRSRRGEVTVDKQTTSPQGDESRGRKAVAVRRQKGRGERCDGEGAASSLPNPVASASVRPTQPTWADRLKLKPVAAPPAANDLVGGGGARNAAQAAPEMRESPGKVEGAVASDEAPAAAKSYASAFAARGVAPTSPPQSTADAGNAIPQAPAATVGDKSLDVQFGNFSMEESQAAARRADAKAVDVAALLKEREAAGPIGIEMLRPGDRPQSAAVSIGAAGGSPTVTAATAPPPRSLPFDSISNEAVPPEWAAAQAAAMSGSRATSREGARAEPSAQNGLEGESAASTAPEAPPQQQPPPQQQQQQANGSPPNYFGYYAQGMPGHVPGYSYQGYPYQYQQYGAYGMGNTRNGAGMGAATGAYGYAGAPYGDAKGTASAMGGSAPQSHNPYGGNEMYYNAYAQQYGDAFPSGAAAQTGGTFAGVESTRGARRPRGNDYYPAGVHASGAAYGGGYASFYGAMPQGGSTQPYGGVPYGAQAYPGQAYGAAQYATQPYGGQNFGAQSYPPQQYGGWQSQQRHAPANNPQAPFGNAQAPGPASGTFPTQPSSNPYSSY